MSAQATRVIDGRGLRCSRRCAGRETGWLLSRSARRSWRERERSDLRVARAVAEAARVVARGLLVDAVRDAPQALTDARAARRLLCQRAICRRRAQRTPVL